MSCARRRTTAAITKVAFLVLVVGCGSKLLSPEEHIAKLVEEGWKFFASGEYSTAEARFQEAAVIDAGDPGVELGLGWTYLRENRLSEAASALAKITPAAAGSYLHARAALAIVYDAQTMFDRSITAAQIVVTHEPGYVLQYDERVDWRDMCYLLAKNYLLLSAQADPDLSRTLRYLARIDTAPELDPDDPATWTAGGSTYGTLPEAALKRLEALQYLIMDSAAPVAGRVAGLSGK